MTGWSDLQTRSLLLVKRPCCIGTPLSRVFELTDDGEDDDHEVEDVPADGEEVAPQRHDLHEALEGEDDDEGQVDVVEYVLHLGRLLVRLHHHGDHVEEDQHHDDDVEGLLPRQVEEEALHGVLGRRVQGVSPRSAY